MSSLTMPMVLFASNYLTAGFAMGDMHPVAAVLTLALLVAALGIVLAAEPTKVRRPRLVSARPALQH